jgi:hypothetical protein
MAGGEHNRQAQGAEQPACRRQRRVVRGAPGALRADASLMRGARVAVAVAGASRRPRPLARQATGDCGRQNSRGAFRGAWRGFGLGVAVPCVLLRAY